MGANFLVHIVSNRSFILISKMVTFISDILQFDSVLISKF